jgi:hypothetical protein
MSFQLRKATLHDLSILEKLIALSARTLGVQDYTAEQIEAALRGAFGVDTELILDGTYLVAECEGEIVGGERYLVATKARHVTAVYSTPEPKLLRFAHSSSIQSTHGGASAGLSWNDAKRKRAHTVSCVVN